MAEDNNKEFIIGLELPSSTDLRGRQSVRATFRLSTKAIEAMSIAAVHLGIKQKSLFDHLIEDSVALEIIARELRSESYEPESRIQKTYVLSRKTLSCLDKASKRFQTPRDALVELSIQRLLPLIEKEKEKHRRRKELLRKMKTMLNQTNQILEDAQAELGPHDPVFERLEHAAQTLASAYNSVKTFIEKGSVIENF